MSTSNHTIFFKKVIDYVSRNLLNTVKLVGDNTTDNKLILEKLINSYGSKNVNLVIPAGIYLFKTSFSVPSNINLVFQPGAIFVVDGVVLTIQGYIHADKTQQIFRLLNSGMVARFQNTVVYPDWWGAKPDGSTINNTYINQAIECCKSSVAKTIEFNIGTYIIDVPNIILDRNCSGFKITGQGYNTQLKLKANTTDGVIFYISNFSDNNTTDIENIEICNMRGTGNTISDPGSHSSWFIHSWMNVSGTIKNLKVYNLDLDHFVTSGMSLECCTGLKVDKITTSYNSLHGFSVETGSSTISNIYTHHNGLYGIDYAGGNDGTTLGQTTSTNIICDSNGYGFKTAGVWDFNMSNIEIYNSTHSAIEKTTAGGTFNLNNIITKNNGGTSLNATTTDGTEVYNINNYHSYNDNLVDLSTNGCIYFAPGLREVHGENIHIYNTGKTGIIIGCKKTYLTNCSVNNNLTSYSFKVYNGGLVASGLKIYNNSSATIQYGMQIYTKENVTLMGCQFGDDRANKLQLYGIDIDSYSTGRINIRDCDFSDCSVGAGISNSTITGKVSISNCINATNYDVKRVQVTALPTTGTYFKGDLLEHVDPDTSTNNQSAWKCMSSGTLGTLSSVTGSITNGSTSLVVNTLTGLFVDAVISISGITGGYKVFKLPNKIANTTVSSNSASGQKVLNVASVSNFTIGDYIVISRDTVNEETVIIESIGTNSITVGINLTKTHATSDTIETAVILNTTVSSGASGSAISYAIPTFSVVSTLA